MTRYLPPRLRKVRDMLEEARTQLRRRQFDRAELRARGALRLDPDNADALQLLGVIAGQQGHAQEAVELLQRAAAQAPDDARLHNNLGNAWAGLQRMDEALRAYDRALALKTDDATTLSNRAMALLALDRADEALADCTTAIAQKPDDPALHTQRAQVLLQIVQRRPGDDARDAAVTAIRRALAAGGDVATLNFMLAALGLQQIPERMPVEMLSALFDGYAPAFDQHLVERLEYHVPEFIGAALQMNMGPGRRAVADLGCGTGLCAEMLRPLARWLVGVDLSPQMLERARDRGLYDELVRGDLVEFLAQRPLDFGLINAADVLPYFGDLDPVFAAVARALHRGGLFALSAELLAGDGFALRPTQRFAHSVPYLAGTAQRHGLQVLLQGGGMVRLEHDEPVDGCVMLLQLRDDG